MYPIVRFLKTMWSARRQPRLGALDTHLSHHRCWPWDIDVWMELNNGRALTLFDLGRVGLSLRTGLAEVTRQERWGMAIAGSFIRYRRRIRAFERIEMKTRLIGWDGRFLYMEQSMWKTNGDCANHAIFRAAATDRRGIVAPARVAEALNIDAASPPLPDWVLAWCAAEDKRPWPPMADPGEERLASAS
ncbi:acyl-CoA thioesterase [Phaeobacter sp. HF9A]|uniref:acyl-CoA thioesterase n=1 Tax=Phaeobacter sp. HF9A TaxID=2721561 RepID=UPI0014305449|nr:acyl-CoA thioesterase [Phaeobacter sp. HF9A]NIZ13855.1 acyl-CoA thioesterase [Phaeobacter sp. HF9A]